MSDNKMADIMKAMALVPDQRIDPNTGQVTNLSNKSVLEKNGGDVPEEIKVDLEALKEAREATREVAGDAVRAYREMMHLPINEQSPSNKKSPFIEVGSFGPNDEEFIKLLAKKVKK